MLTAKWKPLVQQMQALSQALQNFRLRWKWPESQNLGSANLLVMSHCLLVIEFFKEKSESSRAVPSRN